MPPDIVSIPSLTRSCDELRGFVVEGTGEPLGDNDVAQCQAVWTTNRLALLKWMIGPPLVLLFAGLILGWVIRGFRHKSIAKLPELLQR